MGELLSDLDVGRRVLVALDVLAGDEQRVDEGDLRESARGQVGVVLRDVHDLGRDMVAGEGELVREGQHRLRAVDLPGDSSLVEGPLKSSGAIGMRLVVSAYCWSVSMYDVPASR